MTDAQRIEAIRECVKLNRSDMTLLPALHWVCDTEPVLDDIGFLLAIIDRQNAVVKAAQALVDAFLQHEDTDEPFRKLGYAVCTGESMPDAMSKTAPD